MPQQSINALDRRLYSAKNDAISSAVTRSTEQTILVSDIISEGPIEGLVGGGTGIYLENDALQSTEQTEYFGQDFAKLGELVDILKELDLIKSDNKLRKKMQSLEEKNISIVSTATKLRKEYEEVYRALRGLVYPKRKGDLRNE